MYTQIMSHSNSRLRDFKSISSLDSLTKLTADEVCMLFQWLPAIIQTGEEIMSSEDAIVSSVLAANVAVQSYCITALWSLKFRVGCSCFRVLRLEDCE
jgi:hypothetical protein